MTDLGPLTPADEYLHHQITDTFATVLQSDRSWTEKIWAMAAARDGSLSIGFGLGKYANRGVMDAVAGVSRQREQWTVRASRELGSSRDLTVVGPIEYEIAEPLQRIRFVLEPNEHQPVAFDYTMSGVVPPFLEQREVHRAPDGSRLDADVVRYHQAGVAEGWVEVDGVRSEITPEAWVATRDHSWGVRYAVGAPVTDVRGGPVPADLGSLSMWCPVTCERPDGSRYALHWYYQRTTRGSWQKVELQGGVERPDGGKDHFVALTHDLEFDPVNRRFLRGELRFVTADGSERPLRVEAVSETGFLLGAGLYFGLDGHWHGQWRGPLMVEGEHTPDCTDLETVHRLHQLRDCIVRVEDPVGGGVGWGNLESIAFGPHPDLGLSAETSFR
ncbi:MAG: hypothetical protein WCI50_10300 [Actinomycetes bacterium]